MIIVIPAYQPDEKLTKLVAELCEACGYPIVIVDDGSAERCKPIFEALEPYATVLHHEVNRGKGRAMKTAFEYCAKNFPKDEGIITVDADGQHLPSDILNVAKTWEQNKEALVLGSRRFLGDVPFKSRAGNAITRFVFAASTGVKVFDTQTGLRAFAVSRVPEMLELKGERYEYEITQLLHCTKERIPILETPIETVYIMDNESSHFHPWRDSWRIYRIILGYISSSVLCFLVDLLLVTLLKLVTGSWDPVIAVAFVTATARLGSGTLNYFLNLKLVFGGGNHSSYLKYIALFVVNYLVQLGLQELIVAHWGLPWIPFYIIIQAVTYPLCFWIQRKYIFVKGKKS